MSRSNLRSRGYILSLTLVLLLTTSLTLSVVAQDFSDRDTSGTNNQPPITVEEETLLETVTIEPLERDSIAAAEKISTANEEEKSSLDANLNASDQYYFLSANTFVPNDDNMTYTYYDGGCMYRTGGGTWTEHSIELPQGAEIDYLRIFYYDKDALNNALAYLAAYDGYGNTTVIATASSTGTPGQSSTGSGFFSHIVDNGVEALSVSISYGNGTTDALRVCGIRLHYLYNVYGLALPLIQN